MPPPEAVSNGILWKLEKCVYGLNDAARMWYFSVWEELEKLNCQRSSLDYGIFCWYLDTKLCGIFQTHVDDFLWSGTDEFKVQVIDKLCQKFKVGHSASNAFRYIGLSISQNEDGITLEQIDYINAIENYTLPRDRQMKKSSPCTKEETSTFCQLVGKLNWVANQSRPDILFDVCQLSSVMKAPTIEHILKANKVLRKIKEQPLRLKFSNLGDPADITLHVYSDASLGNLPSGSSSGGFVVFAVGKNGNSCPLTWKSSVIRRVVRSTISAETCALVDALDSAYFLSHFLSELLQRKIENHLMVPIHAFTDNESLQRNAYATTMAQEKRLRIDIASVKQMLQRKELSSLKWIPASAQMADSLTKVGANTLTLCRALENGHID